MSLIVRKMRGINLYARDNVRPRWYPAPTNPVAWVEVWAHDADKPATFQDATFIGRFPPGGSGVIEFNPAKDRPKILRAIAFSAAGVPSVRYLDDAPAVSVLFNRLSDAPTLTQVGASEETLVQIAITDFDARLVQARQIQIASNNTFTTGLSDSIVDGTSAIATAIYVNGAASDTRYARVRHSSTGISGPWSAWSNVLMFTFANTGGGGGSSGGGDPWGGGYYEY